MRAESMLSFIFAISIAGLTQSDPEQINDFSVVHSQYLTSPADAITWVDTFKTCTQLQPDIHFQGEDTTVTSDLSSLLGPEEKAWVGYVKDFVVLQIMVCSKMPVGAAVVVYPSIEKCLYMCKDTKPLIIGLQKRDLTGTDCFCLGSQPAKDSDDCEVNCPNSHLLCGDLEERTIAVYKSVNYTTSKIVSKRSNWDEDGHNCLTFYNPNTNEYKWEKCNEQYHPHCSAGYSLARDSREDRDLEWHRAAAQCFDKSQTVVPYSPNKRNIHFNGILWTGNIRVMSILKLQDLPTVPPSKLRQYGYVQKREDMMYLYFTSDTTRQFRGLCQQEITRSHSTKSSTSYSLLPDNRSNSTHMDPTHSSDTIHIDYVAVYIGVSVAVVIILVVPLLLIYWWKHRTSSKTRNETIQYVNQSDETAVYPEVEDNPVFSEAYRGGDGYHDYQYVSYGELNVNPTYFIQEKQNPEAQYVVTEPEPCSVTLNDVNVYNKAAYNAWEDDSYDKIGQKGAAIQDKNTYSSFVANKDTYDTTWTHNDLIKDTSDYSISKH